MDAVPPSTPPPSSEVVEPAGEPPAPASAPVQLEEVPGVAFIKPEFVIPHSTARAVHNGSESTEQSAEPPPSKKRKRGQNKHRPRPARISFSEMLCPSLHDLRTPDVDSVTCPFKERCRYTHDIVKFMAEKGPDIGEKCYVFERLGKCPYGAACRFASSHVTLEYVNVVNEEVYDPSRPLETSNLISRDLQESLRKRKLGFLRSERYLKKLAAVRDSAGSSGNVPAPQGQGQDKALGGTDDQESGSKMEGETEEGISKMEEESVEENTGNLPPEEPSPHSGAVTDVGEIRLRPSEKTKVDFRDKLYLAPLTTTGNLPFRRICKEFGADVTCGEMAMCTNLLQGHQSEWALLKRHQSEDLFGVQICGAHADTMTKCAELINDHTSVDFVDINTGCPIDLVFKKGAGSALMGRHTRFEGIVRGMVEVLDCPLTVKMRTGIMKKNWNAHKLVPKLKDWGVAMATVHGRSREQRYTKMADWDYIKTCVEIADPMPLFGNGDVLTYEDYNTFRSKSGVAGCMIARGALIKPWVFKEIKEQHHWDISSSERLDILRRYTNYGLEHWGSDTQGVENTRKFLLEWLSFLYRYIPVGVLERVPQKINQRPPYYRGRDELETLMASNNCQDWIKISEMLLGPAPSNFSFLPKHKANAYN